MQNEQRKRIAQGLALLDELGFVTVNPPRPNEGKPGTLAAWAAALRDLTPEQLATGFDILAGTWTMAYNRRPTPGDLRAAVNQAQSKDWSQIWEEVNAKAYSFVHPRFNSGTKSLEYPRWSSPVVAEVVRLLGGPASILDQLAHGELTTVRAQFRDVCQNVIKRAAQPGVMLPEPERIKPLLIAAPQEAQYAQTDATAIIDRTRKTLGMSDSSRYTVADKINAAQAALDAGVLSESEAARYVHALHKVEQDKARVSQKPSPIKLPVNPPNMPAGQVIDLLASKIAGRRRLG